MAAYNNEVGRRILQARLQNRPDLGSQEAAAREFETKSGIPLSAKQYGRWERGTSIPRADKWGPLAAMLRVDVESIRPATPAIPEDVLRDRLDRIEEKVDLLLETITPPAKTPLQVAAGADRRRKAQRSASGASRAGQKRSGRSA